MSKRLIIVILISIVVATAAIIKVRQWASNTILGIYNNEIQQQKDDPEEFSQTVPKDYLDLFKVKGISFHESLTSKIRNPVSEFYFKKDYYIQVYKVDTSFFLSLDKITAERYIPNPITTHALYITGTTNLPFDVNYKLKAQKPVSLIYLTLYGDQSHAIVKNDSMAYYHSTFENFSVKFNHESEQYIFSEVNDNYYGMKFPLEIMFLKRKNNLYFILLGVRDNHIGITPGTLQSFIF